MTIFGGLFSLNLSGTCRNKVGGGQLGSLYLTLMTANGTHGALGHSISSRVHNFASHTSFNFITNSEF